MENEYITCSHNVLQNNITEVFNNIILDINFTLLNTILLKYNTSNIVRIHVHMVGNIRNLQKSFETPCIQKNDEILILKSLYNKIL